MLIRLVLFKDNKTLISKSIIKNPNKLSIKDFIDVNILYNIYIYIFLIFVNIGFIMIHEITSSNISIVYYPPE